MFKPALLEKLRQDVARQAGDADLPYALGVALLSRAAETASSGLFAEAARVLGEAVRLAPGEAGPRAALAYALDWQGFTVEALEAAAAAHRLEPGNSLFEAYRLRLLSEVGPEAEALAQLEAAAVRQGVDLPGLRRQLVEAGFPTDSRTVLANGFLHARNFMASWLFEEAFRVEERLDPRAAGRKKTADERELARHQRELRRAVRADRVPAGLRPLTELAQKLGLGDDRVRSRAFAALTPQELARIRSEVEPFAGIIHKWLDGFAAAEMPAEAAALMNLLLGLEERETPPSLD